MIARFFSIIHKLCSKQHNKKLSETSSAARYTLIPSINALSNKWVLSRLRKVRTHVADRTSDWRLYQMVGAATLTAFEANKVFVLGIEAIATVLKCISVQIEMQAVDRIEPWLWSSRSCTVMIIDYFWQLHYSQHNILFLLFNNKSFLLLMASWILW